MQVRLTAKLAEVVNDIDLSAFDEGDIIELSERDARLLIAERWAEPVSPSEEVASAGGWVTERAEAADTGVPHRKRPVPKPAAGATASDSIQSRFPTFDIPTSSKDPTAS